MATIQIRKKSNKVWEHIPNDNIQPFIISKFYTSIDGLEFQVVEQGQARRNKYLLGNITVFDDTSGGTAETFSTMTALSLRLEALKYPAFFNEGESLIDAFTDLTDTPSSYTGQADKVVKVKTDETGLEFGDPNAFNLQINEEGETPISNVNRVEFANATVENLGSGAVKVTPLGGGDTPSLAEVLLVANREANPALDGNELFNPSALSEIITCDLLADNTIFIVPVLDEEMQVKFPEYIIYNNSDLIITLESEDEDIIPLIGDNLTIPKNAYAFIRYLSNSGVYSVTYQLNAVSSGGGDLSSLIKQQFTYTSGAQTFTLTEEPSGIYAVFVNGQELNTDQFSIATNVLTIIDTLISGDKVNILYSGQPVGVIPSYTKIETDALLDDLRITVITVATTGSEISFVTPQIYNSPASPSTANISNDLTGARIGVVQKIYHNHSVAPTVPGGWVLIGGQYKLSELNIIYAEWVGSSRVEYWIAQEI